MKLIAVLVVIGATLCLGQELRRDSEVNIFIYFFKILYQIDNLSIDLVPTERAVESITTTSRCLCC